jgi:hypothetical protein
MAYCGDFVRVPRKNSYEAQSLSLDTGLKKGPPSVIMARILNF